MTLRIPLGPFELHRRIGKGGMGEVWEGLHVPQQVPVAVKVLTTKGSRRDTFIEAFRNEVRAAAGLNHPGIVTVLDYGEMPAGAAKLSEGLFQAKSPYIVMELGRRGSLKRFVDGIGWLEVKAVLFTILDALAHAHAAGVIHRDLKPANILVGCGSEHRSGIKLTDFGLAHAVDQHEYAGTTDMGWGTPQFMAPEQFRAAWRDYGPWTDLYAMGVMTFYLCAGQYPFAADEITGWARAHQLASPREFRSRFEVPDGFGEWIGRLLQKAPRDRYRYAADAAWALQKLGDPKQVQRTNRDTVSMVPIKGERSKWMTDAKIRALGATAGWRRADSADASTMVDRPETTRLVDLDFGQPRETEAMRIQQWHSVDRPEEGSTDEPPVYGAAPPLPYTWHRPLAPEPSPKLVGAGLGLYGLRTLPMVNREPERDALWAMLREAREKGKSRAMLVRGSAGTGKTRLARWLCRRAHEVGSAVVLKAMFSPIAGPGDGLSRMVAQQLRAGGMDVDATMKRVEQELVGLGIRDEHEIAAMTRFVLPFGAYSTELDSMHVHMKSPTERYGLLMRHLERLSHDRPVVVWFDDVQWGADALAFCRYVLERQHHTPTPIMFVMTMRNEALVARAVETELIGDLARNRRCRVLDVDRLDPKHTELLVREMLYLTPSLADEVERRSNGNPLFAVQLVGDWVAGGKLRFGTQGFELKRGANPEIPDDLHAIWRERLALLLRRRSSDDLVALEVAAALGTSVELKEWYAACAEFGVSAPPGLTRDLLETGLAMQTEYGFEFCHGLFRESLERSALEAGRLGEVNAACVRMLEGGYPGREFPFSERFAQHSIAAGDGTAAIGPLWNAARSRIDRSEFGVALSLLDQRDALLDQHQYPLDSREWCVGWVTRAQVHLWQGHYGEVETHASRAAVEARRKGWRKILASATLTEGLGQLHKGDLDRADRLFGRALDEYDELVDEVGQAHCLHGLGRVAHGHGQLETAGAFFQRALDHMDACGDRLGQAQCLNALGDLERDRENWGVALKHARDAQTIFEDLQNAIGVADCVNDIAELHRLRGEFAEAKEKCIDALRRYEALGSEHSMRVRTNLALTLAATGFAPQARQLLDEVRVRFEQTDQEAPLAAVKLMLLPLLIGLGELNLARRRFDEARPVVERYGVRSRDLVNAVAQAADLLESGGHTPLAGQMRDFSAAFLK